MQEAIERRPLTERQKQYYEFICRFTVANFRVPKLDEIAQAMGVIKNSSAIPTVNTLIRDGYLRRLESNRGFDLVVKEDERQYIRLSPGEGATIGNVYIGLVQTEESCEGDPIYVIEVMAPDVLGKLERCK
ncbi:LexA repressor [Gimesia alba]|uniref:LexA repressor n=1 Tax=Gimesia alba TaxID=2527973 RepID=A0A517RB16_9PLAN|nr:hypothetical protein [Gimesia alba]QDT41082.1 LexA repressor [Gimesia alba]